MRSLFIKSSAGPSFKTLPNIYQKLMYCSGDSLDIFSSDRSFLGTLDIYIMTVVHESQQEVSR